MANKTDVLIVGGGPVGLCVAVQLHRFKCSAIVIEKENKPAIPIYGRATTMWCRTMEILDQLDLCEALLDDACYTKNGYNYRNGLSVPGGLPFGQRMDKNGDTRFALSLHLRQRLIERTFENTLATEYNTQPRHQHELVSYQVDDSQEYAVTAKIKDLSSGEVYEIKSKCIVGCDGARSPVRQAAGIKFIGERSANKWIRMDALVETNMPSPRTLNSVQSDSHGLVLWCPIDEGKVRIGYVFNAELQKRYSEDQITAEVVMAEAKKALQPFSLTFKKLDWFTCYGIGQNIGEHFLKGRVILAGDAIHTHSSGSAQGLNTGLADAVNLGWKLALHLRGLGTRALLQTYDEERKMSVQQVIDNDKIISTLISGQLPPQYKDRKEHPRDILDEWFNSAANIAFTLGLGISYPSNNLINVSPVTPAIGCVKAGERGPEAFVSRLGTNERVALQRLMPNKANFYVVIFAGNPRDTQSKLQNLRLHLDQPGNVSFQSAFGPEVIKTLTIFGTGGIAASETMGGLKSFGRSYYDTTQEAHEVYGVDPAAGALVVFRPDGYIGKVVALDQPEDLVEYFGRFLVPVAEQERKKAVSTASKL